MFQSTFWVLCSPVAGAALTALATPGTPAFVPSNSVLSVLAFLAAAAGLIAGAGASVLFFLFHRPKVARRIALATLAAGALYAGLVLASALLSRERTLPLGTRKYFCEMDCHLAYSVVTDGAGTAVRPCGAGPGAPVLVEVQTWFDPSTIASFRGNAPLTPNPRAAFLVDGLGRRYGPSPEAAGACGGVARESVVWTRELRPGESYRTALAFRVPPGVDGLRLWLGDSTPGVEQWIPGHENSFLHSKVYFGLR